MATPAQMVIFRQKLKELINVAPGDDVARKKIADFLLAKTDGELARMFQILVSYLPFLKMLKI